MINRRTKRIAAVVAGLSLVAAACGGDDDDDAGATSATEEASTPETTVADTSAEVSSETAPETTVAEPSSDTATASDTASDTASSTAEGGAMTVTYTLTDAATWSDGSPITWEDFQCAVDARVNTPESISTAGYDQITSVSEGATPNEVVVQFDPPYAAYKTLFAGDILQASQHEDCTDVSADFTGAYTYGSGLYQMTEWTPEQIVYEVNPNYTGSKVPKAERIVIVPAEDGPTLLKSGAVDFIFPQAYVGIDEELADPNVAFDAEGGGQYEGLYFQQDDACVPDDTRSCAFSDDVFREAFSKSIDINAVYDQIYAPFAQGLPLLTCGPIAPGPYCDDTVFQPNYDPEGAAALLEGDGWAKDGSGFWAKDGEAPVIHWMVNTGNTRRESTQEFLIPLLAQAGFNVVADNCEATPCVFQTRLPALSYDLAMYISTVAPDPAYITSSFTCDQIPSEENDFQGQNQTGWCNEEASELLAQADVELDEAARTELVRQAIAFMAEDYMMLPTLQFPNVGAYRTDRVAGTQNNLANYWAFMDWENFEDLDGDGQVVIGAEQFVTPDCTNPITSCANSSWFQWSAGFPQFPSVYLPTNDQTFVPSELLEGEAVVS